MLFELLHARFPIEGDAIIVVRVTALSDLIEEQAQVRDEGGGAPDGDGGLQRVRSIHGSARVSQNAVGNRRDMRGMRAHVLRCRRCVRRELEVIAHGRDRRDHAHAKAWTGGTLGGIQEMKHVPGVCLHGAKITQISSREIGMEQSRTALR